MNTAHAIVNNMPMTTVVAPETAEDLPAMMSDLRATYGDDVQVIISGTFPAYGTAGSPDQALSELGMIWAAQGEQWVAYSESLNHDSLVR